MPKLTLEGKPTLFFSTNEADKSWRLKEKVVAVIESYLQERDDIFTLSHAKITDVIGSLEEVDVAYTSLSDPRKFFSFVEVRDRSKKVGRPYIQEIMGKRDSLRIDACKVVSTRGFSRDAIRLASHKDIPLRLLASETEQNIKLWYKPDTVKVHAPLFEIVKCSILARIGDGISEFKADRKKVLENNILIPTEEPHRYKVISLLRVFEVDVMQNPEHRDELFSKLPEDRMFHKASIAIQYQNPRLYLKVKKQPSPIPIAAIVFFAMITGNTIDVKITERYKYLDAIKKKKIAALLLGSFEIKQKRHYICLMRYNCDGETCQLGGAFFW